MRWIAGFLLVLNIAVFAWFWRMPAGTDAVTVTDAVVQDVPALVLLNEQVNEQTRPEPVAQTPVATQPGAQTPEPAASNCFSVGPFTNLADAELFSAEHPTLQPQLDIQQQLLRTEYRVYIPPFANPELAAQAYQELRARIQDAGLAIDTFLIARGDLENGIALGLFAEQTNALNVERQMTQLGYSVTVTEEARTTDTFHVTLRTAPEGPNLLDLWPQILAQQPYLQRIEKLC